MISFCFKKRNFLFSVLIGIFVLFSLDAKAFSFFQKLDKNVNKGNEYLEKGENEKALYNYSEAAKALPDEAKVHLNRGLALMRQGDERLDEAMQAFSTALSQSDSKEVLARTHYNMGNAFFKKEDFFSAIDNYKKSLLLNPGNKDVAWNLELALRRKKEQEEKQDHDQDQGDDSEQEKQDSEDEQCDGEDKDQDGDEDGEGGDDKNGDDEADSKDQDQEEQDEQGDNQEEQDEQSESEEEQAVPISKDEMERMLEALDDQDRDFHRQKARSKAGSGQPAKDW